MPKEWGSWSNNCGKATRTRTISTVNTTVKKSSCVGLQQSCTQDKEEESRETLCRFFQIFLLNDFMLNKLSGLNATCVFVILSVY